MLVATLSHAATPTRKRELITEAILTLIACNGSSCLTLMIIHNNNNSKNSPCNMQ